MINTGKYCCFNCPKDDFTEKHLQDKCTTCGKAYNFPLISHPSTIRDYTVIKTLGRGFYGATFVAEKQGVIQIKRVLKVVPKAIFQHFEKIFSDECSNHASVAAGATYLVGIEDAFDCTVEFSDHHIECHIAVLEYLEGYLLHDYLSGQKVLSSPITAQIAADLFRIREELASRQINHNDFHAGNIIIEILNKERYRQGAMDPSIRAVAIDFGSLSKDRRSGGIYKSDLHWIAEHIETLSSLLVNKTGHVSDLDSRLALALKMTAQRIAPAIENQRTPSSGDIIREIEREYFRSGEPWRPWRRPLELREFVESYNAQTLEAWHVPQLLVDPDEKWKKKISSPGPLIVTGMRGCGKTMLLRALQFHARAAQQSEESPENILSRIRNDGYVGIFVSASSFLTLTDEQSIDTDNMFARLVIAYSLEASRSLAHLADLDSSSVRQQAAAEIQNSLASILEGYSAEFHAATIQQLERHLVDILNQACRSDSQIRIASHPSNSFPLLARAIKLCASVWEDSQVLFLLDDVSTRYLSLDQIDKILSRLIFQKPDCAFKITSETQTIFLSLKSPGGVEPAAHWRDFKTFDLGSEVYKRLKFKGGKQFVENILAQRAKFYSPHPKVSPSTVVGDVSLIDIAKTITSSSPSSATRKSVYHGMSALKAVCVGDIGSVITIYENILQRSNGSFPVAPKLQSDVFQDFCSSHLYLLDRRGSHLKNVAKSFAAASNELLMQSAKDEGPHGLRQYLSLYVRVTAGDKDEQGKRLRELVDAGVFVFQGGAPRTKTKDSDPIQQFKLTFRKIYGLADFIGLSERDRFELSGEQLEEWLNQPEAGAEILMRNLRTDRDSDHKYNDDDSEHNTSTKTQQKNKLSKEDDRQSRLVFQGIEASPNETESQYTDANNIRLPKIEIVGASSDPLEHVDVLYIALGFEERTEISAIRSIDLLSPSSIVAVRYPEKGRSDSIIKAINSKAIPHSFIDYNELQTRQFSIPNLSTAIDITGLTKSGIFHIITNTLKQNSKTIVVYTEADQYYPLETSLKKVLDAHSEKNSHVLLPELKEVLSGEQSPYALEEMASLVSDGTRMKALLAFASPKHERLIKLVEDRDYDLIKVVIDNSNHARATVAKLAAEVAVRGAEAGSIEACNIKDPNEILQIIKRVFHNAYIEGGLNFEIGLTGDKLEALTVASFCAVINVNSVWYVKPKKFDPDRFTKGAKKTTFYRVSL